MRALNLGAFKFFLSGHGMSVRTGKYAGLAAVTGALTGVVTVGFYWLIKWAQENVMEGVGRHKLISTLGSGDAVKEFWSAEALADPHRWVMFVLPAAGAVLGWMLIRRFARVEHARGTDSAVRAFHRGERIPRTVLAVKPVASVLTVGFGGSAGYEGPVTLLGAACGSVVKGWLKLDARAARILMAAGIAAGIAALFRSPFAGAIFGAEIFYSSSDLEADTIMPSVVASVISYTIFAAVWGFEPVFSMPAVRFENGWCLLPYFALAVAAAFGARFYISMFRGVERWFEGRKWAGWKKVAVGGLCTGALGFAFPDVLGASYSIIQASFDAGAGGAAATLGAITILEFMAFFFVKAAATACTVGSGGSGGVFAPALVCGGSLGAAIGLFFLKVLPAGFGVDPAAFALVGMAGFLASAIRVPLTAVVMVAEISGNHQLLLPTMWVCVIAFWLNNGWSLYRSQVHSRSSSPLHYT